MHARDVVHRLAIGRHLLTVAADGVGACVVGGEGEALVVVVAIQELTEILAE